MTTVVEKTPLPAELRAPLSLDLNIPVGGPLVDTSTPKALPPENPRSKQAQDAVAMIISVKPDGYDSVREMIQKAGQSTVLAAHHKSELIRGKLGDFKAKSEDGGPVADALIALRDKVSDLDPSNIDFTVGWFARNFAFLPFVGSRVRNYFNRFETGQGAIDSIIKSLDAGKNTLENDNRILLRDQAVWRSNTLALRDQTEYLMTVDSELEIAIASLKDNEHKRFLQEEVLFPLRQRIQDLQQRLAVNQQGVITSEILVRNNRELIRGVERALFVTVDALSIAVAAAMALANQKLVLDAVDALNNTTNALLAGTAKRLRTQGVEIQKRASTTMLASDVLKEAFANLSHAIDDISKYRQDALPKMASNILELNVETQKAEDAIRRMERGNAVIATGEPVLDLLLPKAAA